MQPVKIQSKQDRSNLFLQSLRITFLNQKIKILSPNTQISGICTDIQSNIFCLTDATYRIISEKGQIVEGETTFMITERTGKTIVLGD